MFYDSQTSGARARQEARFARLAPRDPRLVKEQVPRKAARLRPLKTPSGGSRFTALPDGSLSLVHVC